MKKDSWTPISKFSQKIEIECEMSHPPKQIGKCEALHMGRLLNEYGRNAADAFNFITITKEKSFCFVLL